jgi:rod shape determining protein RodA
MDLRALKNLDWILFISVLLLCFIGLAAIYSVSFSLDSLPDFLNFKKQVLFIIAGIILMFGFSKLDYRMLKNYSGILYAIGIILLILLFVFGQKIRGTASWFSFGLFSFQPAEAVKLILIIVLAKYFAKFHDQMHRFRHIIVSGIFAAIPAGLILFQPDFGSALVIMAIWFGMLLVSGIRWRDLFIILSGGFVLFGIFWQFVLVSYQKTRIISFFNPSVDPLGSGYNLIQAMVAIGSGGVFGKGLGYGTQSQLRFLPEAQTDFIFAAVAEELGFIGVVFIIFLFAVIFLRLVKISLASDDNFAKMLSAGILIMIASHTIINIAMNMGLAPITGIPLPFLSYGGSFILTLFVLLGIAESITVKSRKTIKARFDNYL